MSDIKWIKITTDMFDNRKIKALRKLPEGNNIVLIWVMLLTLAGRCNAGGMVFLTENIPYTPELLADELGFEDDVVKLALGALERFGMIQTDSCLHITNWEKYQNIEGMDRIREQNRLRKQAQRERERELLCDSHVTVTGHHATDKEEEKEEEKEKEEDKTLTRIRFAPPTFEEVQAYCNERKNNIDPSYFLDYYTTRGWELKPGQKVKDWKACVRTWEKNNYGGRKDGERKGDMAKAESKWAWVDHPI